MIEVLDPRLAAKHGKQPLAPRLPDLRGKRVGVIWNGRPHGDRILRTTLALLKDQYGITAEVFRRKHFIGNIASPEILDEVATQCDAAVTGIGD